MRGRRDRLHILSAMSFRCSTFISEIRWQQMLEELLHVSNMLLSAQHIILDVFDIAGKTLHPQLPILHVDIP